MNRLIVKRVRPSLRLNLVPRVQRSSVAIRASLPLRPLASRAFGSDTHDDFKPKVKSIPSSSDDVLALIKEQVTTNDIVLYMKGTPSQPQCGFSMQAVRILNAVGVDFSSVNVLAHDSIRDNIKVFS